MENRYYNNSKEYVQARSQEYQQARNPEYQQARSQDYAQPRSGEYPASQKKSTPAASSGGLPISAILTVASAVLSLICLISISGVRGDISSAANQINSSLSMLQQSYTALENRLGDMDNTVANIQSSAYNQLAAQSISITKDLTSLTGPVEAGRYNQMFIVKAKGALNMSTSFEWQKYNETTGGWVSIVFTGTATSNDEFGLRLENSYDNVEDSYVTILWANGIKTNAAGTYRCVITDNNGITKTSAEAIVQVSEAAE